MSDKKTRKPPTGSHKIGRPSLPPDEKAKPRCVRLKDAHWAKLQRLGSAWLKTAIEEAEENE